jgi:hypothetical protein
MLELAVPPRWRLTSIAERSPCVADGDDAVLRALPRAGLLSVRRWGERFIGIGADPVAAYPVKTRSPSVSTLVVCYGSLGFVTLSRKIVVEETLIHFASFDYGQCHKKELEYVRCTHLAKYSA